MVKNKMMILLAILLNATVGLHAMDEWDTYKKTDKDNITPLHFYVTNGDLSKVCLLLEQGVDVNAIDKNGATPLHWASYNNHVDIIKILVDKGANINAKDLRGLSPLVYAYLGVHGKERQVGLLKLLISLGADPDTVLGNSGFTPLFCAVNNNDIEFVSMLLKKKVNVHAQDCCGNTPLRYATLNSTPSMIQLLVTVGNADVNAIDGLGQTPLFDACREGNYDNARTLIELGANVNFKGVSLYKYSIFTEAPCTCAHKPESLIPNFSISDGASTDTADQGITPLHIACFNGHEEIVSLLIAHGANAHSVGIKYGTTPLHIAARQGYGPIIEKLLNAGAKADSIIMRSQTSTSKSLSFDKLYYIRDGVTPLFSAIGSGKLDIVKIIAPITNVNKKAGFLNITPLHYACVFGHFDIIKELIKNKAEHTLKFGKKFSAIEIALFCGHREIAQFLNNLKAKTLKVIKNDIQIIRPSETMTIIRNSYGDGYSQSVIFKICKENCLLPGEGGVYYHTSEGIKPVPAHVRKLMVTNHLSHLNYSGCKKMGNAADIKHHFDPILEKECGHWAWVVIDNPVGDLNSIMNKKKKFVLYATLPGIINKQLGVFEFTVKKSLYEKSGICLHRFHAPKGIVGSNAFGAKASRKKTENKLALC